MSARVRGREKDEVSNCRSFCHATRLHVTSVQTPLASVISPSRGEQRRRTNPPTSDEAVWQRSTLAPVRDRADGVLDIQEDCDRCRRRGQTRKTPRRQHLCVRGAVGGWLIHTLTLWAYGRTMHFFRRCTGHRAVLIVSLLLNDA